MAPLAGLRRWASLQGYGLFTRTFFGAHTPPRVMRARFERFAAVSREQLVAQHPSLKFRDHRVGTLPVESVCATAPRCSILYLHGGIFMMGSAASYRRRVMKVSHRCRAEVFVPEYRLAPEHPFPAALRDALEAWDYLARLHPDRPLLVGGDSAGGGLAMSLLVALRDAGRRLPAGAFAFSPWVDHTHSGASVRDHRDLWITEEHLRSWSKHVVGRSDPADPLLSPVFAELHDLPPTLLFVAENEILLDDARRLAVAMSDAGGDPRLHVGAGMQHDWPLTLPWLPEARAAWAELTAFVDEVVDREPR